MGAIISTSGLNLNAEEVKKLSEAIFEKAFVDGDLTRTHIIMVNIEYKKKILLIGRLGLVGKCIDACNIAESSETIPTSEKMWDPIKAGFRLVHCEDDLDQLFVTASRKYNAYNYDISGTEEEKFIFMVADEGLMEMLNRMLYFGDTTAATIANGGNLKNGLNVAFFNCIEGEWKQIFAIANPTGAAKRYYVEIPENAEANYDDQFDLDSERTLKTMRAMYNRADKRLIHSGEAYYEMTSSMHANWADLLETKSLGMCCNAEEKKGTGLFAYRNIPIVVNDYWDRAIASYFDNGTKYDKPHRVILTTPANVPIGTPDKDSLDTLKSFFVDKDSKHYVDAIAKFDIKVLEDYMLMAAY